MSLLQEVQSQNVLPGGVAEAIALELHHTAQPLTILQGLLELSLLQAESMEDYRRAVEGALEQWQRAMAGFNQARILLQRLETDTHLISTNERNAQHV